MDAPTFQDYFNIGRAEVLSRSDKITVEAIDRRGTDVNALIAAFAAMADEVTGQIARVEAAMLIGRSRGKDLDRVAFDRYGLLRQPATPAVGSVAFSTTAPAPGSFNIPEKTLLQSSDGTQFQTTAAVVFPSSSTGPVLAAVRSSEAGSATQAAEGTITNILSSIAGAPADLRVTNPLATAGAGDAEPDDLFRGRALAFFLTARRGTVEAIRQGALAVPGIRSATVFEALDALGRPAKTLQLIISDQFTDALAQLATVPPAYAVQSQVLCEQVFLALVDSRAAGIYVDVILARVVLQSVTLALAFKAGADADQVALRARARVVGYVNSLRPGQRFKPAEASQALRFVPGLAWTGNEIYSPLGDVVPMPLEVLRSTMGVVIASTVQPDRALASTANPDAA